MMFDYFGYIGEKEVFSLHNLCFTLFIKKQKVMRPPTNRALSMGVNSYHGSLISKTPATQLKAPTLGSERKNFVPRNINSSTGLKVSSTSYQPPLKKDSLNSLASYNSMPVYREEKTENKAISEKEKEKILKMEQEELCNIITDSSGNYVVQEVFKICTAEERIQIMEKIEEKLIDLSCHKKGTHSIQTLVVELKSPDEIKRFLDIIKGKELILSSNSYGTFVLQKVVDHFPEDLLVQIHDICRDNFIEMATSNNGLPIIKKALAKFKRSKHSFVDIIEEHTNSLAQHHFGNYAIQVAIENWDQEDCKKIFEIVLNNLQQLSMQKISSNVVEKCIDKASQDTIKEFMNVINNKEFIKMLIRNMYAFFVVERALMRSTDHEVKVQIAHEILSNIK